MDADRNLLFGIIALRADLIDSQQFVEICTLWATRKHTALADLLIELGCFEPDDRSHIDYLLKRRLHKHGGDARATLTSVPEQVKRSLAAVADADVQRSLAELPQPESSSTKETLDHLPHPGERYTLTRVHGQVGRGLVWLAHDN
jgi:hypothetical protein